MHHLHEDPHQSFILMLQSEENFFVFKVKMTMKFEKNQK